MSNKIFIPVFILLSSIVWPQVVVSGDFKDTNWDNQDYTVLDFWASWCEPCIRAFPNFSEIEKKYSEEPVFVLINSFDTEEKANKILKDFDISSKNILDSIKYYPEWMGLDMWGSIIILNRDKTKLWSGGSEILNEESLNRLISDQKIPALPYETELLKIQTDNFEFTLRPGLPHRARGLVMGDDYIKYTNLKLNNILQNLSEDGEIILKDNSTYSLYFDFELKTINDLAENNLTIISLLKEFFRIEKFDDGWVYNTDFLLTETEF